MIFDKIENMVEQYPDSALMLLDSIRNPYELNKAQYSKYILLLVQAKDKDYKDIAGDTLIFRAKDYFQEKNDLKHLALAEFYSGKVLQVQGKSDEAMKTYLEAKKTAKKTNNIHLCGLIEFFIGDLNYDHDLYNEAIIHYKNSVIDFSHLEDKYKNQIASYTCIGNSFLLTESVDSAFFYYRKGLELAEFHNDSIVQADIIQNMGVAHLHLGNPVQAKILLRQALSLTVNDINKAKIYMSLARIFYQENKKDSAGYYANLALNSSGADSFFKVAIYKLLFEIEESTGNYQKSLEYHKQYVGYLSDAFDENESSGILNIQKKYDFELLQNVNKKLVIQQLWISVILIIMVLVVVVIAFIFYHRHTQNKEALLTAKQQIYQLKEMTYVSVDKKDNENSNKLRKVLFDQLNIFKKISLLEFYLQDEEKEKGKEILKKVNKIIHSSNQNDMKSFYQFVNNLYDDFLIRLKNLYSNLNDEDILICCLSKAGLNNTEIALLTKSTPNIIPKKKTAIREKTGMKKQEDFLKQLDEIVQNGRCSEQSEESD